LPDNRDGWIARGDTVDENGIIHLRGGTPQQILKTALSFTGFPYLWGGTTPKGFDCSGFVQTVFRLNGHCLPRDAYQQFTSGTEVTLRSDAKPADLLFFRARGAERITHVAIHLGKDQFIHCSGHVRTSSLDRSAENYDASLEAQFVGTKRIVGGASGRC
jgi:cell wall-associated NlpC family hydrolase